MSVDEDRPTLFTLAKYGGQYAIDKMRALIDAGADVNQVDNDEKTPLIVVKRM